MFNCPKFFFRAVIQPVSIGTQRAVLPFTLLLVHEGQLVHGLKYEWLDGWLPLGWQTHSMYYIPPYNTIYTKSRNKWMTRTRWKWYTFVWEIRERASGESKKIKNKGRNVLKHQTTVTFVLFCNGDHCNSACEKCMYMIWMCNMMMMGTPGPRPN